MMKKKFGTTFFTILFFTILTQILNMLKSVYLAKDFGTSQMLDVFYLSNIFTISIFNVLGVALTTIMIPEFSSNETINEKKNSIESFITVIFFIVFLFVGILIGLLYFGIDIIASEFKPNNQSLFLLLTTILSMGQLFRVQTSFSIAIVQSKGLFILPKIASMFSALIPVLYLLFVDKTDILILTVFVILGYLLECLVLLTSQIKNKEYRYGLRFNKLDDYTKGLLKNTFPIIISSTVFQLQLIISNYVIGFFGEGYISILSNTNQIIGIFQLLFVANIVTLIYPKIAREVKKNISESLIKISKYIVFTNSLVILLVWGYIMLGRDLVNLMFVRGAFGYSDANKVYLFGIFLVLSLPVSVVRDFIYRFLYSMGETKIPALNSIQTVCINIFLILLLMGFIGPYSVIVTPFLGTIISTSNIIRKIKKIGYSLKLKYIIGSSIYFNVIGLIMFCIVSKLKVEYFKPIINFSMNTILGLGIYMVLLIPFFKFEKIREV